MEKKTAMKILKELHGKSLFAERTALETLIPELKESEDERIRKALVRFHKSTIDVDGIKGADILAWLEKQGKPQDKGEISDGYHTFNELYYYRMLYNAAFFNMLPKEWVHKSKRHNDGEECFGGGWFIVMANLPTGQISNHYELKDWDLFQIPEKEVADKWDGHTPQEAADRLHKYLLEKQGESYTKKDVDDAYLKGICDTKHELEKQGEQKPTVVDFNAKDWYVSKVDGKLHNIYQSVDKIEQKPTSDTRYEVKAGDSLSVNGKPFDYEHATIIQKDFAPKAEPKKIEDEIEIPLGAKDSELQEATYYIPKGFRAEIDDDKVVIKKR